MLSLLNVANHGHTVTGRRSQRGMTALSPARPTYGYDLRCTCGWEGTTNEPKRASERVALEHLDEAHRP